MNAPQCFVLYNHILIGQFGHVHFSHITRQHLPSPQNNRGKNSAPQQRGPLLYNLNFLNKILRNQDELKAEKSTPPLLTTTHSFVYRILDLEPVEECNDTAHLYFVTSTLVSRGIQTVVVHMLAAQ